MKRSLVLGLLIAVATLSMVVSGQAPTGPSARAIEATKIEKVKDGLYMTTGSGAADQTTFSGGNTAVFITEGGVTLVDTKLPGWGPTILERVKSVTSKPITRIINTHTHGDHTGNNVFFGATVESVAHENTKASMEKMPEFGGVNAKFLPAKTYKDTLTIGSGKDEIDLYFVAFAEASKKAGRSVEQAAADYKVPAKYKGYVVSIAEGFVNPKGNLQMAYDELQKK